ncbi:hypothetical protein EZS27_016178 [termite gut metagenome]|uniref:Baseplate protein J-like domain-containing protein n=1 Tax=termite gut metagenome TaxID=433724 RepID=A0A5J4RRL5_9ZZZZ
MARTIAEIKAEIAAQFMSDDIIRQKYGFPEGAEFDSVFSKISIENLLFYIVATCTWTVEKLFDAHKQELTALLEQMKPHSRMWYATKAKAFMLGKALVTDTDYYDVSGMTDEEIAAMRIVKYAAVVEVGSVVYIKIAGETDGEPAPIPELSYEGFKDYMREVKDAGVMIEVVNEPAEYFRITMTIYYDPMVMDNTGMAFATGATPVQDTIKMFIKNLPFNGEYRNVSLVDALQKIEGVVIPELHLAETSRNGAEWQEVNAKAIPVSGYYKIYTGSDMNLTFTPYETISNRL